MRYRVAHALMFLVGMIAALSPAYARPLDVTATVLTPAVEALPRQTVSLQVRFTNGGSAWQTVHTSVAVPGGWVVVVPPGEMTLAPGESVATTVTVLVAPDAAAATYTFPLTYRTTNDAPTGEVPFSVRVPAIDQAVLSLQAAPALVPATDPHTVEFLLRNTGNTTHAVDLSAVSAMHLAVTLTPSTVDLGPGESATVVAHVGAAGRLTQQRTHVLTLAATLRSAPDVRTTARAAVLLVPTHLPAAAALHTFPLTIRASYGGRALATVDATPRLALEVSGRGTLSDRDPGLLDLRVRMTPTNVFDLVTVEYRRPTWGVRLGHQDVARSPLSSSIGGFGVRGRGTWPVGSSGAFDAEIAAYLIGGEPHVAVAATVTLQSGVRVGATLGGGHADLVGSLALGYAPIRRDASTLQLTLAEATYAVRARGDGSLAHALRVTAQVSDGPSVARFAYDTAAAAFDDRDRHHASLRATATLRLNDAFSIQARFPIDVAFGYHHTWAWNADRDHRLVPPADAPFQERRSTLGVSAGLGRSGVTASYALTDTRGADHDRRHEVRALVRTRITDDFTVAHSVAWTRRQLLGTVLGDVFEVRASATLRTPAASSIGTTLTVTHRVAAEVATSLTVGATWAGALTPDLWAGAAARIHLSHPTDRWSAGLDLRHLLGDERVLTTRLAMQARADHPLSLTFELGLTVPLQVPLGPRSDIGRLEGSVTRPGGQGLHGAVVTVAGQSVTTSPSGAFAFPALPVGEHQVAVIPAGALGTSEYLVPGLPAGVVIVDGSTSELHFVVHDAATVAGTIVVVASPVSTGRSVDGAEGTVGDVPRGIRIELRNGVTTLHTGTDAAGAFRFHGVPAGDWTLHVVVPPTESAYRADPAEVRLTLEPGASDTVTVRLVPIVRTIQFQDGGTLDLEGTRSTP